MLISNGSLLSRHSANYDYMHVKIKFKHLVAMKAKPSITMYLIILITSLNKYDYLASHVYT